MEIFPLLSFLLCCYTQQKTHSIEQCCAAHIVHSCQQHCSALLYLIRTQQYCSLLLTTVNNVGSTTLLNPVTQWAESFWLYIKISSNTTLQLYSRIYYI